MHASFHHPSAQHSLNRNSNGHSGPHPTLAGVGPNSSRASASAAAYYEQAAAAAANNFHHHQAYYPNNYQMQSYFHDDNAHNVGMAIQSGYDLMDVSNANAYRSDIKLLKKPR
jgi:hypothetical protein